MRKLLLMWLVALWACTPGPDQPVEPVWGKQACEHCMMLVSDRGAAAQAALVGGARKFFDDVGCLAAWLEQTGETPMGVWVRTPDAQGWADAYTARFAAGQHTPMDYGYLPAARGVSFQELREVLFEEGLKELVVARDVAVSGGASLVADDTLGTAMALLAKRDVTALPVMESRDSRRVIGLVKRDDVLAAYNSQLLLRYGQDVAIP